MGMIVSIAINAQISSWEKLQLKNEIDNPIEYNSKKTENTEIDNSLYIPESLETRLDSLLSSWHVKYHVNNANGKYESNQNVYVSDSVYMARLSKLPYVIEMPFNDVVKNCIDLYVSRRPNIIRYSLGLADFYFPMIEQALDENQLPLELKYLAIVESALNPVALSRAGACGLWQFILPTGKVYGLEINSLIDERRDPVKATYAACRYFKDMYEIYGDWHLVIAAYNCGPGNVSKAINKAGGKRDYWAIYNYLPRETRTYVPLFIAACYAMNYYSQHDLHPASIDLPLSTDTVTITNSLHFDQISEMLSIDKELLRALNPQYKKDIIPGNLKPRPLLLPSKMAYAFVSKEDTIYKHRADELFANRAFVAPGSSTTISSEDRTVHLVRSNETLNTIANKYGVSTSQIKQWNGLKSSKLRKGVRLVLYPDNGGMVAKNKETGPEKTQTSTTNATTVSKDQKSQEKIIASASYNKYKVKKGDTFFKISQQFPGISAEDLMKINNTKNSNLREGQTIKVPAV